MKKVTFQIATRTGAKTETGYRLKIPGTMAVEHGPWFIWRLTPAHAWQLTHGPSGYCCCITDTIREALGLVARWGDKEWSQIARATRLESIEAAQ